MDPKAEITRLQKAYALHFDAREAEAFAALFTEDAEVIVPGGHRILGREKLLKACQRTPPGGGHYPEEGTITIDGDKATASSRFRFEPAAGEPMTGEYEDRFEKTADGWRFSYRRSIIDES